MALSRRCDFSLDVRGTPRSIVAQSAASEKEEEIRTTLSKLDAAVEAAQPLSADDMALLRRQLTDTQTTVAEQQDRLRLATDECDHAARRRDELEARLMSLESEYEELLDKTLREEEAGSAHLADTVQDIKVPLSPLSSLP